jgi:hypothetical protein
MRVFKSMKNIIHYVENEMNTLGKKGFNPVDSLVLSQLSYININAFVSDHADNRETLRIKDLLQADFFDKIFQSVWWDPLSTKKLLFAVAASPRFRNIKLDYIVEELDGKKEKQFFAVTFFIEDKETAYIAFRGTDATLIGWKEDFNMAYISPIPSQQDALRYVSCVAKKYPGKFIIGGHSKGGNLAVFAAMMCDCEIQNRIIRVYSHDGPGFKENIFEREDCNSILKRIHKTIPQSSLIGILLESQGSYSVVKSSRIGIMQHDPYSWYVNENDFFILEHLSAGSKYFNKTINDWLGNITNEEREKFVDAIFTVFNASNKSKFTEFGEEWYKNVSNMLAAAKNIDPKTKKFVHQTFKSLAVLAVKNYPYRHRGIRLTKRL